jgi:hypothetical protein
LFVILNLFQACATDISSLIPWDCDQHVDDFFLAFNNSEREKKALDLRMEGLLNFFLATDLSEFNTIAQLFNRVFTAQFMSTYYWPADKCHQSPPVNANFVKWLEHLVVSRQSGSTV